MFAHLRRPRKLGDGEIKMCVQLLSLNIGLAAKDRHE
jgi:hypothetical protein